MENHTKPVPLLDLTRQYKNLQAELDEAVLRVSRSQQFIMGPDIAAFEGECAAYLGSKYALGCSSGTDALIMALMALDIGPGDEVITSAYSFFATAGSIARIGAKPVFVDIEPEGFNIDVSKIEDVITKKTKAIMPVHLFGQSAEMNQVVELAKAYNLKIIEDAAQAIGCKYQGQNIGSIGEIGAFSFFPSKNLGAFGDAGLVSCNDEALYQRLKSVRVHGSLVKYYHEEVGGNFRIDTLQAAVLRVKLKHLDAWSEKRATNANNYERLFSDFQLIAKDGVVTPGKVVLPKVLPGRRHIFNQFVIRVDNRDQLMNRLKDQKIGCEVYYPLSLHQQKCFVELGHKTGDFPQSERAANESLAIPIFPELEMDELERVVEAIGNSIG